jgi:hypothetical protein
MAKSANSLAQRNLALGYSLPIVGGVSALLLGLIIVDLTRTTLDIWVWVAIHFILGLGMVLGTRFSTAAYNFSLSTAAKVGATKGARNLNLVLGIIWSAVVIIVSFSKASQATQGMVHWPKVLVPKEPGLAPTEQAPPTIEPFTSVLFWKDFVPAFVLILIAIAGIYLLLSERSREAKS